MWTRGLTATASVFFGETANAWRLFNVAVAHDEVQPQFLALDLIIRRRNNGTLSSSNQAFCRCPVEVFTLIKDELYPLAFAEVIRSQAEEYADYMTDKWKPRKTFDKSDADPKKDIYTEKELHEVEKAREEAQRDKRRCMEAAKLIQSSSDWEEWATRPEFTSREYGKENKKDWDWETLDSLAYNMNCTEVADFLDTFGLRTVAKTFNIEGNDPFGGNMETLYVPIAMHLAHSKEFGLVAEPPRRGGSGHKFISLFTPKVNRKAVKASFRTLYEKYHIEFGPEDEDGKVQPPNPCWRLHSDLKRDVP